MFEDALVGVDGTSNGRDGIALAARLTQSGGKLTLAHVRAGELHPLHAITPRLLADAAPRPGQRLRLSRAPHALLAARAPPSCGRPPETAIRCVSRYRHGCERSELER
ncbi:MAG TPA: hypothetical protein VK790_00945 [Solirubrobacteraceae bacterium]|nr:hypothetical protein [Solirubrobacteraceae bacterium]